MANTNTTNTTDAGNTPKNGYIAMYKGKQLEVYAATSYAAQLEGARLFKAKKSYEVSVYLCERADGSQVVHTATE